MFLKKIVNIKTVYLFVFLSLSVWAIFAYITMIELIEEGKVYAKIINLSGKQRMLSQKTALITTRVFLENESQLLQYRTELIETMKKEYAFIKTHLTSPEIKAVYFKAPLELDKKVLAYFDLLENIPKKNFQNFVQHVQEESFALLPALNHAVFAFEDEAHSKTKELKDREAFILFGTLLTLIFESLFIVWPVLKDSEKKQLIIQKQSVTDELTQLHNRKAFREHITEMIFQYKRFGIPFSLLILDIDHFKSVNDTYGHLTGDKVLVALSKELVSNIRETDYACRFGGEEFIILLTGTTLDQAAVFAEKLRAMVQKNIKVIKEREITVSIGVAEFDKEDTYDSLVKRADENLYHAKEGGRNRVVADNR